MPVPLEQFVKQLAESGVMSADDVRACQEGLPRDVLSPDDAQPFARELVKQRKLTSYQAAAIYQGKGQSLTYGTYLVLDKLGQGGMGTVFKAEHRRMKRVVALKVMSAAAMKSPDAVKRFHREAEAAAKLTHPNIVAALDADEAGGVHFLVMEYVEGTDLAARIKKHGPLPIERAANYIAQAARGLEYAHSLGVIHRDIKPANLFLTAPPLRKGGEGGVASPCADDPNSNFQPTIKILDMGLARLTDSGNNPAVSGLTQSGSIMGTVDYMSPEQALDTKHADARSDVYSLGCSFYYLLTGNPVFTGDSMMMKLLAHREQPIPLLSAVRRDVPQNLDAVFQKFVAKRPEERYQTMTEVIRDLEACLTGGSVAAAATDSPWGTLSNPFATSGSRTMGSEDPAVQDFLNAISPAASATNVRTRAGTAPASETMASRVAERTQASAIKTGPHGWKRLSTRQLGLIAGGCASALIVTLLVWSLAGKKPVETTDGKPRDKKLAEAEKGWHGWPKDTPDPAVAPFDAEAAKQYQEAWAKFLKVPVEYTNSIGMKFRLIPPGEFLMGAPPAEVREVAQGADHGLWHRAGPIESPQHTVILTQPFYLGRYEVTQREFASVMAANPAHYSRSGPGRDAVADLDFDRLPVEMVDWNDAIEFCAKLSNQEGRNPFYARLGGATSTVDAAGYRLPTEAEWEFACRAGTRTRFWSGDHDEDLQRVGWGLMEQGIHPVGERPNNPFELSDMHGNVWEWCQDAFEPGYYQQQYESQPAVNPTGPILDASMRILRGGGMGNLPVAFRSACRYPFPVAGRLSNTGFRVALPVAAVHETLKRNGDRGFSAKLKSPEFQKWMADVAAMSPGEQVATVERKLKEFNPGFKEKILPTLENGVVSGLMFAADDVADIAPLRALGGLHTLSFRPSAPGKSPLADLSPLTGLLLTDVDLALTRVADLSPLTGMRLTHLNLQDTRVSDLSPLAGMPLTRLNLTHVRVTDLSPLKGMPLTELICSTDSVSDISSLAELPLLSLDLQGTRVADLSALKETRTLQYLTLYGTQVSDLSPVAGLALRHLNIHGTPVADLTPLKEMPLELFGCQATRVSDLSPLAGSPLSNLNVEFKQWRDYENVRSIKSLQTINGKPAADFWKEFEARQEEFEAWTAKVAGMPAKEQIAAVSAKLKELNPEFDGKLEPFLEAGKVTAVAFSTEKLTDLSPVRAMHDLKRLTCDGTESHIGRLVDLSPLKGMSLNYLSVDFNDISDLSPLEGMSLAQVNCAGTKVSDLTPLRNAPLVGLYCQSSLVTDLTPLRGMPVSNLGISGTRVTDLEPLRGMKLNYFHFDDTAVSDLSPLAGSMTLRQLTFSGAPVADLTPLKGMQLELIYGIGARVSDLSPLLGMPLTSVGCDFSFYRDAELLRSMKLLATINYRPAAEFWKDVNVQQDAFKAWCQQVSAMPVENQAAAVAVKLKEFNPTFDGQFTHKIDDRAVTEMTFCSDSVADISPLRALPDLTVVFCNGTGPGNGRLADLWPLKGLKLQRLHCNQTQVSDLSPLNGMPLADLTCIGTQVKDLTTLKGMPLKNLDLDGTGVSDLTPLKDLPLSMLWLAATPLSDLSALTGMRLTEIGFRDTQVKDLSPLKGMPLTYLEMENTPVTDVSPLKELPLVGLRCTFQSERDAEILRSIKTLVRINRIPAAEVLKDAK